jgi:hypothetical protein
MEPLLEGRWPHISTEIDRGSTPEKGEPLKSERIKQMRHWALKRAHTGAHGESYNASIEDAELAYRMTAALAAYLSRKVVQAERSKNGA